MFIAIHVWLNQQTFVQISMLLIGLTATMSGSDVTRMDIKIKLTTTNFTSTQKNKSSDEYKTLKSDMVAEV